MEPVEPATDMTDIDLENQSMTSSELAKRSCWTRTKYNISHQRGHIIVGCFIFIAVVVIFAVLEVKYGHEKAKPTGG
jgi:hypothetical protein